MCQHLMLASGTYVPHEVPELAQDAKHLMRQHQAHSALVKRLK